MWWDLPRLLPLYMQVHCGCVWSLYTSPGWEILLHERHQCLPRKRRGVENPCSFLMGKISQATLKVIKRWWKLKLCIHFLSRWNCVHKNDLFCWYEPVQVPIVTPNCCPFLLDSWRHTSTIRQENCPLLPKSLLDVEDVNTGDWRETEWWINCRAVLCKNCNQRHFLIFKVRQGCHLFVIVDWPRPWHKRGRIWSNCHHQVTATAECCHDQLCFL